MKRLAISLRRAAVAAAIVSICSACSREQSSSDVTQVVSYVVKCDSVSVGSTCEGPSSRWAKYPHTVILSTNEVRGLGEGRGIGRLSACRVTSPNDWSCLAESGTTVSKRGTVVYGLFPEGWEVVSKVQWCFADPNPGQGASIPATLFCLLLE
jgi:hypothetical protein